MSTNTTATSNEVKNAKPAKEPRVTIRTFTHDLIMSGELDTKEIVDEVKSHFPKSACNKKHVYWYTTKLRAAGAIA